MGGSDEGAVIKVVSWLATAQRQENYGVTYQL